MSHVDVTKNSGGAKQPSVAAADRDKIKREKNQESNASYIDHHNEMSKVKALVPVVNSGEPILSDDETPKIMWNMDKTDKRQDRKEKSVETIELIESGDGEDGNEVTITLEFTTNDGPEENSCGEMVIPEDKTKPRQITVQKSESDNKERSIAEIAKRQLETLAGQKRGRRLNKPEESIPSSQVDKTKLTKLKSKESSVYIEIVGEDDNTVQLPLHVLGRNKENPESDILSNGRKPVPPRPGLKMPQSSLASDILSTNEIKKIVCEKFTKKSTSVTVIDNRILDTHEKIELASISSPKVVYSSTIASAPVVTEAPKKESGIEIPQEYLYSDIKTEDNYGITETTVTNDGYDEDLLAILEGDHEPSEPIKSNDEMTNSMVERRIYVEQGIGESAPVMSEELTRQIAMQQLMSLPKKVAKPKSNSLVDILRSDWSDNERKSTEELPIDVKAEKSENANKPMPDVINKIKSPLLNKSPSPKPLQIPQKSVKKIEKPVTPPPAINAPAFKRTRIIKKKIIWDPDAPETQISYASLVQGNQAKRAVIKKAVVVQSTNKSNSRNTTPSPMETNDTRKRSISTSPSPSGSIPKKKKISELDKLLGDEGAINMLNALERENQKTPTGDDDKKTRMISKTRQVVIKPQVEETQHSITYSSPKTKQKREIVLPKSISLKSVPKKRIRDGSAGPKGRNSWDYVYSQRGGDDSLIIRRRSNSSYSSSTSPRRLSLEVSNENSSAKKRGSSANKKMATKNKSPNFQFAKPNAKDTPRKSPATNDEKSSKMSASGPSKAAKSGKMDSKLSIENNSTLIVTYLEDYIQFNLTASPTRSKSSQYMQPNYLTLERMAEIVKLLKSIENDDQYNCVLISSADGNFCEGLDLRPLCKGDWDNRRKFIKEYATGLIQFLITLLHFKKPLIAGVEGVCSNLGVTILPLFDYVIADSRARFSTDYAKMGQIPEGFSIACQSNKMKQSMMCDLFYLCQTIPAAEASEGGLITQHVESGYAQFLLDECKTIASHSTQALQAMKAVKNRCDNYKKIESDLLEEQNLLMKHWASDECQSNMEDLFDD